VRGVAGTVLFSITDSSLMQEVHAKEALPTEKLIPQVVVLYQYEACPFYNKVKDTLFSAL
jgi:microsomal prostaglandin-E synthase 2